MAGGRRRLKMSDGEFAFVLFVSLVIITIILRFRKGD